MAYLTLMILLLTVSQSFSSASTNNEEEPVELSLIEKILLFPCCIIDCQGLGKVPLDQMAGVLAKESTENIQNEGSDLLNMADKRKGTCSAKTKPMEGQRTSKIPNLPDYEESCLKSGIISVWRSLRTGQAFLYKVLATVWHQCQPVINYTQGLCACAMTNKFIPEEFLNIWHFVIGELGVVLQTALKTCNKIPCEWALADHTLCEHLWDSFTALFEDINWYIFTTLAILATILSLQLAWRNRGSQQQEEESVHLNQTSFYRVERSEGRMIARLCEEVPPTSFDQDPMIRTHGYGSPKRRIQACKTIKSENNSPTRQTIAHKITKASLEIQDMNASPVPTLASSPRPRLVDVGVDSATVLLKCSPSSDINEATDTSDLSPYNEKSTSPKPLHNTSMPSQLWIRYGSSPARKQPRPTGSKMTSPVWVRQISNVKEGVTAYIQKQASPIQSTPSKRRYIPSPIFNEDCLNRSFDVDIGDPCCSSSFIEECFSESEGKIRGESGDGSLHHSHSFRPSIITKRYTKSDFSISRNSSADSMLMNVSDMNKSITLYTGDGDSFFEDQLTCRTGIDLNPFRRKRIIRFLQPAPEKKKNFAGSLKFMSLNIYRFRIN